MRNTFEAVEIVIARLNASDIREHITGGIYKKRPQNSKKIDITVNALPIDFEQLQQGVLNVNIHVPNVSVRVNGSQDNTQPDTVKLADLTSRVTAILEDVWSEDWSFHVQQQTVFEEPEFNEHYSNIRIEFYSENL